jgi:hypothetical protein
VLLVEICINPKLAIPFSENGFDGDDDRALVPTLETALRIAHALDVDLSKLLKQASKCQK